MNAVKNFKPVHFEYENKEYKSNLILLNNKTKDDKKEEKVMTNEYLNEMLDYFYSHGGPIMKL